MRAAKKIDPLCCRIGERLLRLAQERGAQTITEEQFTKAVLQIEEEEAAPAGLNVCVSNTLDEWTVLKIRQNGKSEVCAEFEFFPESGEFRRVGSRLQAGFTESC